MSENIVRRGQGLKEFDSDQRICGRRPRAIFENFLFLDSSTY